MFLALQSQTREMIPTDGIKTAVYISGSPGGTDGSHSSHIFSPYKLMMKNVR